MSFTDQQTDPAYDLLNDCELMASVLEARHGVHAQDVASFFACVHIERGDEARALAWHDLAERIAVREIDRERTA